METLSLFNWLSFNFKCINLWSSQFIHYRSYQYLITCCLLRGNVDSFILLLQLLLITSCFLVDDALQWVLQLNLSFWVSRSTHLSPPQCRVTSVYYYGSAMWDDCMHTYRFVSNIFPRLRRSSGDSVWCSRDMQTGANSSFSQVFIPLWKSV